MRVIAIVAVSEVTEYFFQGVIEKGRPKRALRMMSWLRKADEAEIAKHGVKLSLLYGKSNNGNGRCIDRSKHTKREELASVIPGKKGADQERTQR